MINKTIYQHGPVYNKATGRVVHIFFADIYNRPGLDKFAQDKNIAANNFQYGRVIDFYWLAKDDPLIESIGAEPVDNAKVKKISENYKKRAELIAEFNLDPLDGSIHVSGYERQYAVIVKTLKVHPSRLVVNKVGMPLKQVQECIKQFNRRLPDLEIYKLLETSI